MHLLAAKPGEISDGGDAVDLGQTPGDVVVLTAADTEIAALAAAHGRADGQAQSGPSLRLANLLRLAHPMSVDVYVEAIVSQAKLVIVRLLGGRAYWPYGVEQIAAACRARGIMLAMVPGDDQPDADLMGCSTLDQGAVHRIWQYLVHGGPGNATNLLAYGATLLGRDTASAGPSWAEPAALMRAGFYHPAQAQPTLDEVRADWRPRRPVVGLVFYRALMQAANTGPIDTLMAALSEAGLNVLAMFVTSLKDPVAAELVAAALETVKADVVVNTTGFAVATPGGATPGKAVESPLNARDTPVLQAVLASTTEEDWRDGSHGLSPRDIAMGIALPEVDGRVISRAVAFKNAERYDAATQTTIVGSRGVAERAAFVAQLAANWCRLRRAAVAKRRVAVVLANYPTKDGRIGNGVGLDTPASAVHVLQTLNAAGYGVDDMPADGAALMAALQSGPTNAGLRGREVLVDFSRAAYDAFFAALPEAVQDAVTERWGTPDDDPMYVRDGAAGCFAIAALTFGTIAIGVQPARGYNIDPVASYHDPALVPPHGYLAFYGWLRQDFAADAVVHLGKHGNLEWLPGKSLALNETCFPDAILGPMPHLYPFIVNDPGEGTQAKRRAQAVIIDHLTPPLTRAESYGPLRDLERVVDEYFDAASMDPRRVAPLRQEIFRLSRAAGLDKDLKLTDDSDDALGALDTYLCELKEMQIRDGLHVFGKAPEGTARRDLVVALTRTPRGEGQGGDGSLTRSLAADLGLDFDPLDCDLGAPWTGARPVALAVTDDAWRTAGDTVERLEMLAAALVEGSRPRAVTATEPQWTAARAVLDGIAQTIGPAVDACGPAEQDGLLAGLDGRFVAPGPSGAPTRGRPDVLPTGRNFYSVDTRAVPTAAAWHLGWKSAGLLVERYAQEHGDWPRAMAVTAWGTSNMRTGGDDIAQALALMGVRPKWDAGGRVVGFEVMPVSVLGRPRVDVTLRISGFFRDAFGNLIELFDGAARAVAALDETAADNPLADRARAEGSADRVFGSKPGAYGAGLQALIDERGWDSDADLARAYVAWGGYAYRSGSKAVAAHGTFERRLAAIDAVVQNQDNREHDLLDSDDYYQFEGGMTAAVRVQSGRQPAVYHNDHSRPFAPKIRRLDEEVSRVVRARVLNPKWINGVMRHGYKGAVEMAATVDYLFAFAATARCVRDDQFEMVYDAYLDDGEVQEFLATANPAALREIAERFLEAQDRGLWRPKSNSAYQRLTVLARGESA